MCASFQVGSGEDASSGARNLAYLDERIVWWLQIMMNHSRKGHASPEARPSKTTLKVGWEVGVVADLGVELSARAANLI